jgi:DNA-binding CsgD family transcriptional regulator
MMIHALVSPHLVARDEELAALVGRRDAAVRGRGSLILLEGEAGIGKSRLIEAFCESLSHGRASVGIGLCREFGTAPYGPIREAFTALGAFPPPFAALSQAEELIELRARLVGACHRRARILILEDLQWADEASLAFLHYLLPQLGSLRLLVLATFRGEEISGSRVAPYVARLARDRSTYRISLPPLTPPQTRLLVRTALGERHLPSMQIEQIVRRSDGNPFFAEELLTNALESQASATASDHLPLTINAAVMERIAKLDDATVEVVSRAAIAGPRFEAATLASAFAYSMRDVLGALRSLRDAKLIVELAAEPPTYAFRHALTREAIYDSMLAAERRPLHARILETFEGRGGSTARDLGYHAWAAMDAVKCFQYNERAGDEADALHAYSDAVRAYELALQGDCDRDARVRLLVKAATSSSRDGMAERAAKFYGDAASLLSEFGSSERVAELYYAMGNQARLAGDNRRAMRIIEQAARALPEREDRARAMLRVTSAFMHLDRGEVDVANSLIAQAQAASDMPIYHNALAYAAVSCGDVEAVRSAIEAHARLSAPLGRDQLLRVRFNLAFDLCILGLDAEALAKFDAIIPELEQSHLSSLQVLAYANAAIIHARAGRWEAAHELVERGLAIPEPTTTGPIALAAAGVSVGHALGDAELAERCASERIVEAAFESHINSTLGRLAGPYARWLYGQGELARAREVLRRASELLAAPLGATETILAASEFGDEATRATAVTFLPALDALSHLDIYAATAHHVRALEARTTQPFAMGRSHAERAAKAYRRLGWVLHEASSLKLTETQPPFAGPARINAAAEFRRSDPLSSREREVAALVAKGTANKGIAKKLSVSQRTIEKHLTSIYDKLGLRNRAQLAAFLARDFVR